ncbi:MAG: transglutaminase domain-containing protein [Candidatus Thermoplasmatota archaeon]|nr:transglutaminase domain-containing protein [Candidatus Thermoplasmatota archaeon]
MSGGQWKMRTPYPFLIAILLCIILIDPLHSTGEEPEIMEITSSRGPGTNLILDEVVEVPPGGETRLILDPDGEHRFEGYIGTAVDKDTKLARAASLLPEWLKDDFLKNMLEASSRPIMGSDPLLPVIPAFGDLDADGDEDLVIGKDGDLHFYKNIGSRGNPIYSNEGWNNWGNILVRDSEFISPSIFDINGDGYGEVIWGDETKYLNIMWNRGIGDGGIANNNILSIANVTSSNPPTHISPAPLTGENNTFKLYFGCGQGMIYYWEVLWEDLGSTIGTKIEMEPSMMTRMAMLNFSSPRLWRSPFENGEYHNVIGMSIGSGNGIMKYHPLINGHWENPVPDFFKNILATGQVTPVPVHLNGDHVPDLAIGMKNNIPSRVNFGDQIDPYWAPDPSIPAFQVEKYETAFDEVLSFCDEGSIAEYLDSIISPPDTRYRDEIGFACAHTPPSQLRDNRLARLIDENVMYIYGRDTELEYVRLVEIGGADPYTTASYRVRVDDRVKEMEITRDAYYWGIVHPRVTEEPVAYIDPETGGWAPPESGGRYWREYLFEHADEEYPPGPDFPDDWTGRKVYYPRNSTPPLLKEVLEDVNIYWDLQPYEYPGGFDNDGEINSHPWDYRDHAIEKVSHWVEKTLVINQQESPDEERPNQPVRIAHGHNGNCGELQDLTIAAARCALIPARGVHLTGEDHVWSEFYLGGWHQWDNYWSDGGGVVANDLNYWWGWRDRGGSGLWASDGAGQTFDVGERYRPPEITGNLQVTVVDKVGNPVEGARVVVLSHWTMENAIDTGDYQGPIPTVPLPSIWGYTDRNGWILFNVWRQNFNIRVASDLGTYISDKFMIADDEHKSFHVQLQSEKPRGTDPPITETLPEDGKTYLVSVETLGSYQYQRDITTGVLFRNTLDRGMVRVNIEQHGSSGYEGSMFREDAYEYAPMITSFRNGNMNVTISLSDINMIKSYTRVRIKVYEMDEGPESGPELVTVNSEGPDSEGFQLMTDYHLRGWLLYGDAPGDLSSYEIEIGTSLGNAYGEFIDQEEKIDGIYPWRVREIIGEPGSIEPMSFNILNGEGTIELTLPLSVKLKDDQGPIWDQLIGNGTIPWGKDAEIGIALYHPRGQFSSMAWINYEWISTVPSHQTTYLEHEIIHEYVSGPYGPGPHKMRITTWDDVGNIRTLVFRTTFDPVVPHLSIGSPYPGQRLKSDTIEVKGSITDDVELSSFILTIGEQEFDLTGKINEKGQIDTSIDFKAEPGEIGISVNATDNVGLWNSSSFTVTLLPPPDEEPPVLRMDGPEDGEMIEKGEVITFRGKARDGSGLSSLALTVGSYRAELLDDLVGNTFSHEVSTERWPTGIKHVTLRGVDTQGNTASISMEIEIYEEVIEFIDMERPQITVSSPGQGATIELGSILTISGKVTDDSQDIMLIYSIDGGASYDEAQMTDGTSFDLQIDTMDILGTLDLSPSELKRSMSEQIIILKAMDGAGRERYLELEVNIEDHRDPTILSPQVEYSEEMGTITVKAVLRDDSMVDEVMIEIFDAGGDRVRNGRISHNELDPDGEDRSFQLTFKGPFASGDHLVVFHVYDAWGNSATTENRITIQEDEGDGGISYGRAMFFAFIIFVLVGPFILYAGVRILRRKGDQA